MDKKVNRAEYPFSDNFIEIDGRKMHYVDEGKGEVILFLHGIPDWSYTYRNLIKVLSKKFRCIAPDNLGFGLSDKPADAVHTPHEHSRRLLEFIHLLKLENVHLFVHDYGGPIGLSYAIKNSSNVKSVILSNTWLWPLNEENHFKPLQYLHGIIGRWLYLTFNFSVNFMVPMSYAHRKNLTAETKRHLKMMQSTKEEREGTYKLMLEMLDSKDWFEEQWNQITRINDKPFLVLWGMKDKFFPRHILQKWLNNLQNYRLVELSDAGHFIQEEAADKICDHVSGFIIHLK